MPKSQNNRPIQKPNTNSLPEIKQNISQNETIRYVLIDPKTGNPLSKKEAIQKTEKAIFGLEQQLSQAKNQNEHNVIFAKITTLKLFLEKIKML